jgi:putative hemolysin
MLTLTRGRYQARQAETTEDLRAAQRLRWLAFRAGPGTDAGPGAEGLDRDGFDGACTHVLIEEASSGALVCCFRLMHLPSGAEIGRSYSAQFYELSALHAHAGPMVEMGRFCVHPAWRDPDILRVAWAAMTAHVDATGVQMMFGCSSFQGTEAQDYLDAFALLHARHLAPPRWLPRVKAPAVVRFAGLGRGRPDLKRAMARMPPLLRTYLMMGGWVSDHAVVDRDLGTMHVFTGLEVGRVPAARARALRGLSAAGGSRVPVRSPG